MGIGICVWVWGCCGYNTIPGLLMVKEVPMKVVNRKIERQRVVRCPAVGAVVLVEDEAHNRLSCIHCDCCEKITRRSVHCGWIAKEGNNAQD